MKFFKLHVLTLLHDYSTSASFPVSNQPPSFIMNAQVWPRISNNYIKPL